MRNKRETDISSYMGKTPEQQPEITFKRSESSAKRFFKGLGKFLLTIFSVLAVAGIVTAISLAIYIIALASEPTGIDLKAKSMNQTSRIFIKDSDTGEFTESRKLYSTENRIWVDNQNIPDYMKEAQVAIEDKRFYEHNGVDWQRTLSAVAMLATGSDSYGGSTITQQLIKNITDDNEVSINRKLREICKALKLEQEYGVEAAAQLYFGKSIKDCSLAECAAIAGITQNPSRWNPLIYPENNRERRELILSEMYDQGIIKTKKEYDEAMSESAKMTFVGFKSASEDDEDDDSDVQNWYYDQLFYDLREDLALYYNISPDAASEKIYTEGLKIYCAMDEKMQNYIEKEAMAIDKSADPSIELGSVLMDFDGRVIATVGSSNRKTTDLAWDRAAHSALQPGSSIKPLFVYPIAIENKQLYFSSTVLDEPIEKYEYDEASGGYISGPKNAYGSYLGNILLPDAIERSSNAVAVQVMELIGGPSVAYEQAVTKMNFKHLTELDGVNTGALSIGGLNGGVTVREMAAAYTYMGNEGLSYKPYTYYYITDSEDNIILDNRDAVPKQAYSAETAGIMNRLLHYNVENSQNTYAMYARVSGWDIVGKTGTTDNDRDCWFCGMSPYAVMATWTGFDSPQTISDKTRSAKFFANVMGEYLKDKEQKEYKISKNLIPATYNPVTGLVISTDSVSGKYVGYYTEDNMPAFGSAWYDDSTYDWNAYSGGGEESSGGGGESSHSSGGGQSSSSSSGGGGQSSGSESSEGPVVPPEEGGGGGGGQSSAADAEVPN